MTIYVITDISCNFETDDFWPVFDQ